MPDQWHGKTRGACPSLRRLATQSPHVRDKYIYFKNITADQESFGLLPLLEIIFTCYLLFGIYTVVTHPLPVFSSQKSLAALVKPEPPQQKCFYVTTF